MPGDDATARYRNYLVTFGITQPGDRVVEQRGSERGGVRFFAYADGAGLRLKAAVTPDGLVTPGPQRDDDWHGFLAAIGDAEAAADRIAWLESDEAERPHGFPIPPWTVAGPASLQTTADEVTFVGSFLPSGIAVPQQWTIRAQRGAPAEITFAP